MNRFFCLNYKKARKKLISHKGAVKTRFFSSTNFCLQISRSLILSLKKSYNLKKLKNVV